MTILDIAIALVLAGVSFVVTVFLLYVSLGILLFAASLPFRLAARSMRLLASGIRKVGSISSRASNTTQDIAQRGLFLATFSILIGVMLSEKWNLYKNKRAIHKIDRKF